MKELILNSIIQNLHYYLLLISGLIIWIAKYISTPTHRSGFESNVTEEQKIIAGLSTIFLLLALFLVPFLIISFTLILFIFIFMAILLILVVLFLIKKWLSPLTYYDIYLKNNTKIRYCRIIENEEKKYLIKLRNEDFIFINKDKIKKIRFNEEEIKNKKN